MFEKSGRPNSFLSFADGEPTEKIGSLIPRAVKEKNQRNRQSRQRFSAAKVVVSIITPVVGLAVFALVAVSGYGLLASSNVASVLTVNIFDTTTNTVVTVPYGPQESLAQLSFFTQTRDAFIEDEVTFIEVDFDTNMVRYFEKGVLSQSTDIVATGVAGSWWDAPSGLYRVEAKQKNNFSNVNQVYLPWSLTFEGNYVIHGIPTYPDNRPVTEAFAGGGIRLNNQSATELYNAVDVGVPILVHKASDEITDTFAYVPTAPEIGTPRYLVADLGNGTILAATESDKPAPIASLTKLMTAVVAAEKLNLDSRVQVASSTLITSLIPRLADRTSVSMYSLLQLLLVESSNEAADVIAEEYGRVEFVQAMNDKARQLGMVNTTFADPSGVSAENVSTAEDLFRLTEYIQENRQFIFAITQKGEVNAIGEGEFLDLNNLNGDDEIDSFIGGKVGETEAAGQTLISVHEVNIRDTKRKVAVILLGSTGRKADLQSLLQYLEEEYN